MQSSTGWLKGCRKMFAQNRYFCRVTDTEGITLARFLHSVILLLAFAAFAFVLFGHDIKVIGLTVAIGWLLTVLREV
jgi:hypothetical protein